MVIYGLYASGNFFIQVLYCFNFLDLVTSEMSSDRMNSSNMWLLGSCGLQLECANTNCRIPQN